MLFLFLSYDSQLRPMKPSGYVYKHAVSQAKARRTHDSRGRPISKNDQENVDTSAKRLQDSSNENAIISTPKPKTESKRKDEPINNACIETTKVTKELKEASKTVVVKKSVDCDNKNLSTSIKKN